MRVTIVPPPPEQGHLTVVSDSTVAERGAAPVIDATVPGSAGVFRASVLKAGLLGVLLGMIPLFGSVLTGVAAVWFHKRSGAVSRTASLGAKLGAAAAAIAFSISALFTAIQVFVLDAQKQSEEAMLRVLGGLGVNLADPEVQASIHRLFTPSGMLISFIFGLIVSVALGAFGGAVAGSSRPRPRD